MMMIIASRPSSWQIFQLIFVICCCFIAGSNAVPFRVHSIRHDDGHVKERRLQEDGLTPKEKMYLYKDAEFAGTINENENDQDDYYSLSDSDYSGLDLSEEIIEPDLPKIPKGKPSDKKSNSTKRDPVEDLIASAINISCNSATKKNQRLSSSFIDLSARRGMADRHDEMEAKIMRSVHVGEDVTLCWIETTTIKENTSVVPPVRLVIREYTISFENSATIPNPYLECSRLPGEIEPGIGNDKNLGKKGLFEIIDEDTKKSRMVNFTIVDHEGEIVIWKHKRVQCGVGSVVTKSILEWSSDSAQNPKKRVEIKVSPKLYGFSVRSQPPTTTARPALMNSTGFDLTAVPSLTTEKSSNDDLSPIIRSTAETIVDTTTDASTTIDTNTETSTTVTECCNTDQTEDAESTEPTEPTEPTELTVSPTTTENLEEHCKPGETCEISSESVSSTESSTHDQKITLNGSDESCSATSSEYCETSDEVMFEDGISFKINDTVTTRDKPQTGDQVVKLSTTFSTVPPSTDSKLSFASEDGSVITTTESLAQSTVVLTEGTTLKDDMNLATSGLRKNCIDDNCHTTTEINNVEDETLLTTVLTEETGTEEAETNILITDSIPTTMESRRSTIPTPQTGITTTDTSSVHSNLTVSTETKHRLVLKIKVTLEHVNERMEKQNLIEVEKNLLLHEDPREHSNNSIMSQVRALNDSISFQKLQTLFNCSSLEKLNKRISKWAVAHYSTSLSEDQLATTSASELLNETSSQRRKKRALDNNANEDLRTGIDRLLDSSLTQEGRKNLSRAKEERPKRLDDNYRVLRRWTRETLAKSSDGSAGLNTLTEFSIYAPR
ncbi:probable serine/threonine-protein kinase nek3 [Cephus cinctus]|uniref:Probable serine/threonine-protein kinase nek3 n=1 Tax=Cephus cinctus TaxID=211228 RepID=A0AAJ7FJL9_CEPCN|nr:probable serine/threonine-protein kinase nek3 [Cephus cinctus]